jgi:hypothetical protein
VTGFVSLPGPLSLPRGRIGLALIARGELLILIHHRPISDYDFPLVWYGFILLLDAAIQRQLGRSLIGTFPRAFWAMLALSAAIWWLFELFDLAVDNWIYIGAQAYSGISYVALATLDFSTVLPAVWLAAALVNGLAPGPTPDEPERRIPVSILILSLAAGVACVVLPVLWPRYFFGLVWGSMFLILDPLNAALGRPSMLRAAWSRNFRLPIVFALGALFCGFFWEAWNFWAMPKWIYNIPYVGFWHIFEMPLLGYSGYLPFGLELFAIAQFALPLVGLKPPDLVSASPDDGRAAERKAS